MDLSGIGIGSSSSSKSTRLEQPTQKSTNNNHRRNLSGNTVQQNPQINRDSPDKFSESIASNVERPGPSTRKLRTRTHKPYYAIPFNFEEDEEINHYTVRLGSEPPALPPPQPPSTQNEGPDDYHQGSIRYTQNLNLNLNQLGSSSRSTRLNISRENRVPSPPPLPKTKALNYLDPKAFPAWLLGDAIVRSSENYLKSLSPQKNNHNFNNNNNNNHNQNNNSLNSNPHPLRTTGSSMLGSSPIKNINSSSLFSSTCGEKRRSTTNELGRERKKRSISPEEELENRRESFWSSYEYDLNGPHLQKKYSDRPQPKDEHWPDLDLQNFSNVPEPVESSSKVSNHLLEVFVPSSMKSLGFEEEEDEEEDEEDEDQDQDDDGIKKEKISNVNNNNNFSKLSSALRNGSAPFGFGFLPPNYPSHRKL